MTASQFARCEHDLGGDIMLAPMSGTLAAQLGPAFSAIDPWASYPYPASGLTSYFAAEEPNAPRYVILERGTPCGALGLRLAWLRGPYVQFLGVLPATQNRGAGRRVMDWVEAEARSGGERNLWVAASDFNAGALRFYERHGFTRVADLDALVRDGRTEILLRKRLT